MANKKGKKTNAFVLFGRAFKNARGDFWVSIQVLLIITFFLALLFYFVEHTVQPDEYKTPWDAFVWAATRYIGDPGHFAGNGPITLVGRYIDTFIGILKILIFAVPAGLVANGFRKAMEDDKHRLHMEECRERVRKAFTRILNKRYQYRAIPRRVSLVTLQAKKNMSEKDIVDTARTFDEFRLRNMATSQTASEHPQDRLVIEMIPLDDRTVDGFEIKRTKYGIRIDRGSDVTIVAPTAAGEIGMSHFCYYLAQFGGFNLVSREFLQNVDDPVSYYTIQDKEDEWEAPLKDFVKDIREISGDKGKWNLFLLSSDDVYDTQIHFISCASDKTNLSHTVLNNDKVNALYSKLSADLKEAYGYLSDLDEKYRPVGNKNIGMITGGGTANNALSIRISYGVTTWSDTSIPVIVDMAKDIKQLLEKPERAEFVALPSWKEKGCSYGKSDGDKESTSIKTGGHHNLRLYL